jgi:hypothetical protein
MRQRVIRRTLPMSASVRQARLDYGDDVGLGAKDRSVTSSGLPRRPISRPFAATSSAPAFVVLRMT